MKRKGCQKGSGLAGIFLKMGLEKSWIQGGMRLGKGAPGSSGSLMPEAALQTVSHIHWSVAPCHLWEGGFS